MDLKTPVIVAYFAETIWQYHNGALQVVVYFSSLWTYVVWPHLLIMIRCVTQLNTQCLKEICCYHPLSAIDAPKGCVICMSSTCHGSLSANVLSVIVCWHPHIKCHQRLCCTNVWWYCFSLTLSLFLSLGTRLWWSTVGRCVLLRSLSYEGDSMSWKREDTITLCHLKLMK